MTDDRDRRSGDPGAGPTADGEVEILGFASEDEDAELELPEPEAAAPPAAAEPAADDDSEAELARVKDRYLRVLADFDNFRKRAERERDERHRYALAEPLRDLLPVIDNLERALASPGDAEDLKRGVEMVARQFLDVLRRYGVEPVRAVGERFDPKLHEAVMRVETPAVEVPTVIGELQRGYRLHDRLLRPALVRVAVPPEPGNDEVSTPADGEVE